MGKISVATKVLKKGLFLLKHYGPTIATVAGAAAVTVGTVEACKATIKVGPVKEKVKKNIDDIHDKRKELDPREYRKQLTKAYIKAGGEYVKLYAPAALIEAGGLALIFSGHRAMCKRNLVMAGMYTTLGESYKKYRQGVISEYGEEKDRELMTGKTVDIPVLDPDGNPTGEVVHKRTGGASIYAVVFGIETTPIATGDPDIDYETLINLQSFLNEQLQINGFVLLNDVYCQLGLPITTAGHYVGWVKGHGDGVVHFGLPVSTEYRYDDRIIRNEDNGRTSFILDFNVDGDISWFIKSLDDMRKDGCGLIMNPVYTRNY